MPVKKEAAQALTGQWKIGMFEAPCKAPVPFCFGCLCTCCAAQSQREKLLNYTGEPYICCAGLFPCGPLGQPQDRGCLWLEACCCPGMALSGNRFMIQTRFDRMNTACDDCIITFTCIFVWAIMILRCFIDIPDELENLADCLIMTVNGCMHSQQHIELEEITKAPYGGPSPGVLGMLPPAQAQMAQMGKPQGGGGMGGGAPGAAVIGAAAVGGAAAAGAAGASRNQGQQVQQIRPQQAQNKSSNNPQVSNQPQQQQMMYQQQQQIQQQQQMAMQQAQPGQVQVQCGVCQQIFASPQSGCVVACPYCSSHNQVPAQRPQQYSPAMQQQMMYQQQQQQMQQGKGGGKGSNGMMMAAGAGAGVLGGMMMADMLM